MMEKATREQGKRVMEVVLKMKKMDIKALEDAYNQ